MFFVGKKGRDRARERWEAEGGENGTQGTRGTGGGGQTAMKRPFKAWLKEERRAYNSRIQGGQNTQDSKTLHYGGQVSVGVSLETEIVASAGKRFSEAYWQKSHHTGKGF